MNPEVLRAKVRVFVDLHRKSRQLDQLNRQLHHLSSRLMTLQDDERRQIARELHENLGQDLVAAKMMVDHMDLRSDPIEANERARLGASTLMQVIIQKIRSISHLLHPPLLDEIGLSSAIQWYLDELRRSRLRRFVLLRASRSERLTEQHYFSNRNRSYRRYCKRLMVTLWRKCISFTTLKRRRKRFSQ